MNTFTFFSVWLTEKLGENVIVWYSQWHDVFPFERYSIINSLPFVTEGVPHFPF